MKSYIEFVKIMTLGKKTFDINVNSTSGVHLGKIKWFGAWRQYCFYPEPDCVFSKGCLEEIQAYINLLMDERKPTGKPHIPGCMCPRCGKQPDYFGKVSDL